MNIIQASTEWEKLSLELDKNFENIFEFNSSSIIINIAIKILNYMYDNKVIKLILTENSNLENKTIILNFIRYFNNFIYIKDTNEYAYNNNIFVSEFNSIFNNKNIIEILNFILDNIIINENNDENILRILKDIIKIEIIEKNNKNIEYINKQNFKNKIKNNLNVLQNIMLDNMFIIHESLFKNKNLYYNNEVNIRRYNSFPKEIKIPYIINNQKDFNDENIKTSFNNNNITNLKHKNNNNNKDIRNGLLLDVNKILNFKKYFSINDNYIRNNIISDSNNENKVKIKTKIDYINHYNDKIGLNQILVNNFGFQDTNIHDSLSLDNKNQIITNQNDMNTDVKIIKLEYDNDITDENIKNIQKFDEKSKDRSQLIEIKDI